MEPCWRQASGERSGSGTRTSGPKCRPSRTRRLPDPRRRRQCRRLQPGRSSVRFGRPGPGEREALVADGRAMMRQILGACRLPPRRPSAASHPLADRRSRRRARRAPTSARAVLGERLSHRRGGREDRLGHACGHRRCGEALRHAADWPRRPEDLPRARRQVRVREALEGVEIVQGQLGLIVAVGFVRPEASRSVTIRAEHGARPP